jgi:hypothetical protein
MRKKMTIENLNNLPDHNWTIPVGYQGLPVINVKSTGTDSYQGQIMFAQDPLTIQYSTNGEYKIIGSFEKVTLNEVVNTLVGPTSLAPLIPTLAFDTTYILVKENLLTKVFQCGTNLSGAGALALDVHHLNGKWQFAAALQVKVGHLSQINGFSWLSWLDDFGLSQLIVVISTFSKSGFTFGFMKDINSSLNNITLPSRSQGISKGLTVFGQWQFNSQNNLQKALKYLLPSLPQSMDISLIVTSTNDMQLGVTVSITKLLHMDASLTLALAYKSKVEVLLKGIFNVWIQGSDHAFIAEVDVLDTGIVVMATLQSPQEIAFGPCKIGNLAVEVGVDWELVPTIGLAANIEDGNFEASIAVLFDSNTPTNDMIAGSVSDVNLGDVLKAVTDNRASKSFVDTLEKIELSGTSAFSTPIQPLLGYLQNRNYAQIHNHFNGKLVGDSAATLQVTSSGDDWFITDLTNDMNHYQLKQNGNNFDVEFNAQFYFTPQHTTIGNLTFNRGFGFNGKIIFFDFWAQVKFKGVPESGFAFDAKMSKIELLNLFSITDANDPHTGPSISLATYGDTHFTISGKVSLLNIISTSIKVDVNKAGCYFKLSSNLLGVFSDQLSATFNKQLLDLKGQANVSIGEINLGPAGVFDINSGADATVHIHIENNNLFGKLSLSFELLGKHFSPVDIEIDVNTSTLHNLEDTVLNKVKEIAEEYVKSCAMIGSLGIL